MEDLLSVFTFEYPLAGAILILMFAAYIFIFILQVLKKKNILAISMGLGLFIGLLYLVVSTNLPAPDASEYVNSMYMWLTMAWNIFMVLLLLVLPLYIFTMVSTTFTNARHHKGGRKLLLTSFLTLWGMTLLGIVIAILLFPIMFFAKDFMQLNGNLAGHEATGIFGGIWPELEQALNMILVNYGYIVIISIILALILALFMNIMHSKIHNFGEPLITFFEHLKEAIRKYLKWVSKMVPYVICGMLIVLFANYDNAFISTLSSLSLFTMLFFLGLSIVWGIEYSIVWTQRNSKDKINNKEFIKITREYAMNDFAVQSAPVLYPITVAYVEKTGVSNEVLNTTPTLSTFMGYSMCGGFYPALVVMFTMLQGEPLLSSSDPIALTTMLLMISIMIPLIMIMTLGMTGVPGADVAIILGLLSALGLNPQYFYTIYLIEPMLDKFRGVGNSMGFAAASVITDKIHSKQEEKDEAHKRLNDVYEELTKNKL